MGLLPRGTQYCIPSKTWPRPFALPLPSPWPLLDPVVPQSSSERPQLQRVQPIASTFPQHHPVKGMGESGKALHFKGSAFHRVIPGTREGFDTAHTNMEFNVYGAAAVFHQDPDWSESQFPDPNIIGDFAELIGRKHRIGDGPHQPARGKPERNPKTSRQGCRLGEKNDALMADPAHSLSVCCRCSEHSVHLPAGSLPKRPGGARSTVCRRERLPGDACGGATETGQSIRARRLQFLRTRPKPA
jgi:hypothetical protein